MTRVERLQRTGILRRGRKNAFRYVGADGKPVRKGDLERIEALRIPPAWTEVAINRHSGGMLQAVGKDSAGRWQYLYHEAHVKKRERKKFHRLLMFAQAMPKLRRTVSSNLRRRELDRDRVMACILRILSTCFMRPGSQVYASENGSYGIATLRPRHVKVRGDVVEFSFPGKRRIPQQRELRDRPVARVLRELLKQRGSQVFRYRNGDGEFVDVRRREINAYIKEVMGERFTSKDFRTWAGTLICACALAREGAESGDTKALKKRKVVRALKKTADVLGNTPAVCRSSYICPEVLNGFDSGQVIEHFDTVRELVSHRGVRLNKSERALLRMLKRRFK